MEDLTKVLEGPENRAQALMDEVAEFSAACPRKDGCEDEEANGLEACGECHRKHKEQVAALCTCGHFGGVKRSSEGLCPVHGKDLPIVAKERRELTAEVTQLRRGIAKLAYNLAGSYDGPGSGPTLPGFWLVQALGEDYDKSILEAYTPVPLQVRVAQTCTSCHKRFQLPPDEGDSSSYTTSQNPTCPSCQ